MNFSHQLQAGCSVNVYMVHGGTNFGFSSSTGVYAIGFKIFYTSYDFDALISESGDITSKYHAVRNVIKQYMPMPDIDLPRNESKMVLPPVKLRPKTALFSPLARLSLGSHVHQSKKPLLFENFTQNAGFLLYETKLNDLLGCPSLLSVTELRDRAIVYLNNVSCLDCFEISHKWIEILSYSKEKIHFTDTCWHFITTKQNQFNTI